MLALGVKIFLHTGSTDQVLQRVDLPSQAQTGLPQEGRSPQKLHRLYQVRGLYSSLYWYNKAYKELLLLGLFYKKKTIYRPILYKKKLGSDKLSLVTDPKGQKNL